MPAPSATTESKKSTAKKPTAKRRTTRRRRATPTAGVKKGDMFIERHGQRWEPIACGEHRAVAPFEATSVHHKVVQKNRRPHLEAPVAVGFQPSCADCVAELESTIEHADRNATV